MSKILFVGNSHTYYNDMPYILQYFTNCSDVPDAQITMLTQGGKSLAFHKEQPQVRFNILYGGYEYVVLQQLQQPFGGEEELVRDALVISRWIHQAGAQPVTYMIWSRKDEPERQDEISRAHRASHTAIGGILAPVGDVWQAARQAYPDMELYDADGRHASPTGSYLIACVFYAALFGKSPEGLPSIILRDDREVLRVDAGYAEAIQKLTARMVLV